MRVITIRRSQLSKTPFLVGLLILMAVWFLASSFLWWRLVYTNPEQVFWDMLANNFSTPGYSRSSSTVGDQMEQSQISQIQYGKQNVAETHINIVNSESVQRAEVISTPTDDFLRYVAIKQPGSDKQSKAVGVWARNDQTGELSQSFNQLTLFTTYFPMGIMTARDRSEILDYISTNSVYNPNFDDIAHETINGRKVYTYKVTVQLQTYVDMLKQFASATGQSDRLVSYSPDDFAGTPPVELEISIDPLSHRLVRVLYPDNDNSVEAYGGYGISNQPVVIPDKYKTPLELQELLQQ